jgi:hypothetical protein
VHKINETVHSKLDGEKVEKEREIGRGQYLTE